MTASKDTDSDLVEEGTREKNRRAKTQDLLRSGEKLFIEFGVERVTIDQITGSAKMAKGNFYRYFEDKRGLVDAIIEPSATKTRDAMKACSEALERAETVSETAAAYAIMAMRLAQAATSHPAALHIYVQEQRCPKTPATEGIQQLSNEISEATIAMSRLAVERSLLEVEDPRVSALAVIGSIEKLGLAMMKGDLDLEPPAVARILVNLVLNGIRKTE